MPESFQEIYGDIIPDDCLPVAGLRMIVFLTNTGETRYRFRWTGDAPVTEILGLLELVKGELLYKALAQGSGEDEPPA